MKFKANVEVGRNAIASSKNLARSVNGNDFDSTGNVEIDTFRIDYYNKVMSVLPLSHFSPGNITSTGYIVSFNTTVNVLLSGKVFSLNSQSIDLTSIKSNPANTTFYVYVILEQGLAKYLISDAVIAESGTTAYNVFWVGNVITNSTAISTINVISRNRLDVFSPSSTAAGSSFPVSTGLPSQTGTISW